MVIHSKECIEETEEREKLRQEWMRKWPNYCKTCEAKGAFVFQQRHPYGSTTAYEDMVDVCEDCGIESPRCPRCGVSVEKISELTGEDWFDEEQPCLACGWNWGKGRDDFPFPVLEGPCLCQMEQEEEYWKEIEQAHKEEVRKLVELSEEVAKEMLKTE